MHQVSGHLVQCFYTLPRFRHDWNVVGLYPNISHFDLTQNYFRLGSDPTDRSIAGHLAPSTRVHQKISVGSCRNRNKLNLWVCDLIQT